jgi:hypothetical protein
MPTKTRHRSVTDDRNDLARKQGEITRRREIVAGELAGANARAAQLDDERLAEFKASAAELRDPDLASIDERRAVEHKRQADLKQQLAELTAAAAAVEREIAALYVERRIEWADEARKMSALEAADRARLVKVGRELLASHTETVRSWLPPARTFGRDKLSPELPFVSVNARVPGRSLADRITLPSSARVTVNRVELFDPIALVRAAIEFFERHPDALPAAVVPPDALQGRAGMYRDTVTGAEIAVDDDTITSPMSPIDPSIDELGCAHHIRYADLPAGFHRRPDEPAIETIDLGGQR